MESIFFAKQELITYTRTKRSKQHFATGKNFSFNQCHKQRFLLFFPLESYVIKAIETFQLRIHSLIKTHEGRRILDSYAEFSQHPLVFISGLCKHEKRFLLLK